MANEQNLIPGGYKLTLEEQKRGGIRSGEVRKEKATMKKTLEMLLNDKNKKGITYRELATLGLINGAVKGNAQNYKTILEMLGEVPKEQFTDTKEPILNITINSNDEIKEEFYKEENNG